MPMKKWINLVAPVLLCLWLVLAHPTMGLRSSESGKSGKTSRQSQAPSRLMCSENFLACILIYM